MKRFILFIAILISVRTGYSQFSVIQDGDGETSFQLFKTNSLLFNAKKEAIGFTISPKEYTSLDKKFWTITSSANAKDASSSLFKGSELQFNGKFGANRIVDKTNYTSDEVNILYHYYGFELLINRNTVFDSTLAFNDQIDNSSNIGARFNFGFNVQNSRLDLPVMELLGVFTGGLSVSLGVKDNTDVIDQLEIITTTKTLISNSGTRTVSKTLNAYDINSISNHLIFGRINFDYGKFIFKQRVLANFHITYAIDEGLASIMNPSFGFFITESGAPLEAVIGIQLQTKDWFNSRGSVKTRWERTAVVLTAGFPFN